MIEFYKTISPSEVGSTYLNLTDNNKKTYGKDFPESHTKLSIIDKNGIEYNATKHGKNQIWGNIKSWFNTKNIQPGTLVKINYNNEEIKEGKNDVHIEIQNNQINVQHVSDIKEDDYSTIEISFEFEKQLESFLRDNLTSIESGLRIYTDSDGNLGKQYVTDVGIIDLLCIDNSENFVVIELKKKSTSDIVVGQILRYMGWVKQNLNNDKEVRGIIITP